MSLRFFARFSLCVVDPHLHFVDSRLEPRRRIDKHQAQRVLAVGNRCGLPFVTPGKLAAIIQQVAVESHCRSKGLGANVGIGTYAQDVYAARRTSNLRSVGESESV